MVSFSSCSKTLMASAVGRTNNLIVRRSASRSTSCITGNRPYAPVPMTSCRHFQGMFSSTESGVCPNSSRSCLDAFFLRLEISPRSITTSCSYVLPSIWMEPKVCLMTTVSPARRLAAAVGQPRVSSLRCRMPRHRPSNLSFLPRAARVLPRQDLPLARLQWFVEARSGNDGMSNVVLA